MEDVIYKRSMVEVIGKRLAEKRRFIQVFLGSRQAAGKTKAIRHVLDDSKRIESKGLLAFKKRYPRAKTLIVGTGGMELNEFLETPILKLFHREL